MLNPDTFKCKRCGKCCKGYIINISKKDIKRIKRAGYEENDFLTQDMLSPRQNKSALKTHNGRCVFLKKKKGKYFCEIYSIRPLTCQRYPFFKKNIENCNPEYVIQALVKPLPFRASELP